MGLLNKIKNFLSEYFFNSQWRCLSCGKEIFGEAHFCEDCLRTLPFNEGAICNHCGRKLEVSQEYCSTCKGRLTAVDKCRSVYVYKSPISTLIKNMKYYDGAYVSKAFGEDLASIYYKNYFNADCVVYVPMTEKAERKRGYNQSKLLAEEFSNKTGLPIYECLVKNKQTTRQAKLNKEQRLKNLQDVFRVVDKKAVLGKKVVVIDDVTTTGATVEALSNKLKSAGAVAVYALTVASVPSKNGY